MSSELLLASPLGHEYGTHHNTSHVMETAPHKQIMSSVQSLGMVKIFLNASLGCICFARGLLPRGSQSFEDRRTDDLLSSGVSLPLSYEDFLHLHKDSRTGSESQPFKILVRGRDERADSILNLVVSLSMLTPGPS